MKKRRIYLTVGAILLGSIVLFGSRPFSEFVRDPLFEEIEMEPYPTIQDAARQVELRWLPQLPSSTRQISEKRQIDYGTSIIQFSFDQSDFPNAFPPMTQLDSERAREVGPKWIVRRAHWIPQALRDGRADKLFPEGFQLFRLDQQIENMTWYLLLHAQKGIGYGWSSNSR